MTHPDTRLFLRLFVITLSISVITDAVWLGVVAREFYSRHLGFLMKTDIDWLAAGIFYLLYVSGLLVFVIIPAVRNRAPIQALLSGLMFGLVAYGTYDLTNQATIREWPVLVTVVDLLWGGMFSGFVSWLSYRIAGRWGISDGISIREKR